MRQEKRLMATAVFLLDVHLPSPRHLPQLISGIVRFWLLPASGALATFCLYSEYFSTTAVVWCIFRAILSQNRLRLLASGAGNLIIRAALTEPVLKAYLPALWLFLSLSGPHLGYLCSPNKLFCSGMWLFKKFTAGAVIAQIMRICCDQHRNETGLS